MKFKKILQVTRRNSFLSQQHVVMKILRIEYSMLAFLMKTWIRLH